MTTMTPSAKNEADSDHVRFQLLGMVRSSAHENARPFNSGDHNGRTGCYELTFGEHVDFLTVDGRRSPPDADTTLQNRRRRSALAVGCGDVILGLARR